jgi:hypothetical protein
MKIIKTLVILALLNTSLTNACETSDPCAHRWWLNLGFGIGSTTENDGRKVDGSAGQISFNGMITKKLFLSLASTHLGHDDDDVRELALLLGYKNKNPNWYWSVGAGIANLEIQRRVYYNYYSSTWYNYGSYVDERNRFAVPVEGQLFWTPFKHFGIGVIGHASLSKQSMGTAMLGIQFS